MSLYRFLSEIAGRKDEDCPSVSHLPSGTMEHGPASPVLVDEHRAFARACILRGPPLDARVQNRDVRPSYPREGARYVSLRPVSAYIISFRRKTKEGKKLIKPGVSQRGPNARDRRDDTSNFYSNSKRDSLNVNCGRYTILPPISVFPRFDIEFTPRSTFLFSPRHRPSSPPPHDFLRLLLSPRPPASQISFVVVCISIFLSKVLVNRCHFLNEYMLKSQLRISRDI